MLSIDYYEQSSSYSADSFIIVLAQTQKYDFTNNEDLSTTGLIAPDSRDGVMIMIVDRMLATGTA